MQMNDRWPYCPADTLLLHVARKLARENTADWYIVPYKNDLYIAKLMVTERLRFVRVLRDDGLELRFTSIMEARVFLKNVLSVPRAAVYLEEMQWAQG